MISNAIIFIGLNIADALTTKLALSMGAIEVNPISSFLKMDNLVIRGIAALIVVVALHWFGKQHLLDILNVIFLAIVLWGLVIITVQRGSILG